MSVAQPAQRSVSSVSEHIPRIGLTTDMPPGWHAPDGSRFYGVTEHYGRAVRRAGGVSLQIDYADTYDNPLAVQQLHAAYDDMDGLILSGGLDISPEHGGAEPMRDDYPYMPQRDQAEKLLINWAEADRKPCLFICRGLQIWNVYNGGSLYQDIPTDLQSSVIHASPAGPAHQYHPIGVASDSRLRTLVASDEAGQRLVNSHHHQAIRRLGSNLLPVAGAPDGIIEAVETTVPNWLALGVQWHAESMPNSQGLFRILIEAARQRRLSNQAPHLAIAG